MHRNHRDSGYTLVEIMATITIIGILVTIAVASYWYSTSAAHLIACQSNRRALDNAIQIYQSDNSGMLPDDVEELAPYVTNIDFAAVCPSDPSTRIVIDPDTQLVTCAFHDD